MKIWSQNILLKDIKDEFTALSFKKQPLKDRKIFYKSPHIAWSDLPKSTKSLAIILYEKEFFDDIDVLWIHWLAYNIDPSVKQLPENANKIMKDKFEQNFANLKNNKKNNLLMKNFVLVDNKNICLDPICTIKVFALKGELSLSKNFKLKEFFKEIKKNKIEEKELNFSLVETNFPPS